MIDKDKVIKGLRDIDMFIAGRLGCEKAKNFLRTIDETITLLKEEESIVRCKDCKYHHYDQDQTPYCDRLAYEGIGWKDNDFCSYAEKRWWE